MIHETYGPGGYDPTKPNNNIISREEIDDIPMFDGNVELLAFRVEEVAANAVALGIALAKEAGVSDARVQEIVAEITG